MMGENPFLSDPNINKVRKALSRARLPGRAGHLPHRDRRVRRRDPARRRSYLEKDGTYTNTDRRVQIGRKVLDPPGEAREDWRIICEVATRIGLPMDYESPREVFDELVSLMPNYAGLSLRQPRRAPASSTPTPTPSTPTARSCCSTSASTPTTARPTSCPPSGCRPKELPDEEYPFVLNTGRLLEHWHTGLDDAPLATRSTRSRREAHVYLNPATPAEMGVADGDYVRITSPARARSSCSARALAPRHAGHLLHPVPLPRGGGQRADHRRDRPVRQDPRVQVLRREGRARRQRPGESAGGARAADGRRRRRADPRPGRRGARRARSPAPA